MHSFSTLGSPLSFSTQSPPYKIHSLIILNPNHPSHPSWLRFDCKSLDEPRAMKSFPLFQALEMTVIPFNAWLIIFLPIPLEGNLVLPSKVRCQLNPHLHFTI